MHSSSLLTSLATAALVGLISNVKAQVPSVSEVEDCDTQWTSCNEAWLSAIVSDATTTYTCQTDYENCILGSSVPAASSTGVIATSSAAANSSVTATIPTVNATSAALPTSTLNATSAAVPSSTLNVTSAAVPSSTLNVTSAAVPSSTLNVTGVISSASSTADSTITGTAVPSSAVTIGGRQVDIDQITQCDTQWETCNEDYLTALASAVTAGTAEAEVVSYSCQTEYESCIAGSSVISNATATTAVSPSALPTSNTTAIVPTISLNTTGIVPTVTGNVTATAASTSGISIPSVTSAASGTTGIASSEVIPGASSVVSSASSIDTATDIPIPTGVGLSGRWVPANRV